MEEEMELTLSEKSIMLGKIHDSFHDSSKSIGVTDTILVGSTYAFNLIMLLLISISLKNTAIFYTYILVLLIVNILILLTFKNSRQLKEKIHEKQLTFYSDLKLEKYFDQSAIENYRKRYTFWFALDVVLGGMVLVVSFISKYSQTLL